MRPLPTSVKVMLVLAAIATTLPIFAGYVMGFSLLLWLVFSGNWRLARGSEFSEALRPVHLGVLLMAASYLVAALVSWVLSDWSRPLGETLRVETHMLVKHACLWFVLSASMVVAHRRGWSPARIGPWFCLWLAVQFIYCVVQRYTGIDWTHGLHAVLEQHRFAYGVYRVSGFMGHPLELAYNLMLILLTAVALGRPKIWWAVSALAGATLLISGSRFVLLVIIAAIVLCEGRRLLKYRYWVAALAAVVGVVLWVEGSIVGRFGELFDEKVPLLERFPRLVFWKIHWQMFLDHPLAGVGKAGYNDAIVAYYTAAGVHDNMYTAHNMFLQALADTGLIGLAGFLALIVCMAVAAKRLGHRLGGAKGPALLTIATVFSGLMQNNLRDSEYVYALWFLLSLVLVRSPADLDERKSPENFQPPTGRPDSA